MGYDILCITCRKTGLFCCAKIQCFAGKRPLKNREACPETGKYKKEVPKNMAADARVKITLRCNECKQRNYNTMKNKKNTSDRVELKKYCRFCRKHTTHTETK